MGQINLLAGNRAHLCGCRRFSIPNSDHPDHSAGGSILDQSGVVGNGFSLCTLVNQTMLSSTILFLLSMLTKIKAELKAGDIDDKEITAANHWRDHRLRRFG